jgi:hypothetical protein
MKEYFGSGLLFGGIAFAIGLAIGIGLIGNAKAADYNSLTSTKPSAVVELVVPLQHILPLRIFACGPDL